MDYIGEIPDTAKSDFLGGARALLFPIDWPEPFGLTMIEAMACGTPVIGSACGSVPEVVDEGVTGFIVRRIDEAVRAIDRLPEIDREGVRRRFDERFRVERMAHDYLATYALLCGAEPEDQVAA